LSKICCDKKTHATCTCIHDSDENNRGHKKFGEKGNKSLIKELNQLHKQEALLPIKREDMLHEEKKKVLSYLKF